MGPDDAWRAAKQWVPFAARTAFYGTVSCTLGPVTADHRASLWAMRTWCRRSAEALDLEVVAEGLENVPASGAFVYCSNHQSIVDILILGSVLPGDFKWAAKSSLWKVPFLGWHLRLAGHVPVERGKGAKTAAAVIARFVEVLKQGKPVLVFPEGTRSDDGTMRGFRNGAFHAAVRAGVPVVPVALEGTYRLMKKGARDTGEQNDRVVRVKVGAPIEALPAGAGREGARVADLRDRTREAMAALLTSIGGIVGDDVAPPTSEPPARRPRGGRASSASL
jgi:1-acyl-sn-glycerol-3-phosphate acyltransferase